MTNQEQIPIERKITQKELTQKNKRFKKRIKSIRTLINLLITDIMEKA